jgi:hypothetical protein
MKVRVMGLWIPHTLHLALVTGPEILDTCRVALVKALESHDT